MNTLDLKVYLTPPGDNPLPGAIARIKIEYDGATHEGVWLFDPLTDKQREDLRWYLERYWMWPYEGFKDRAENIERMLEELGSTLYQSIFGNAGAMAIVQPWRLQPNADRQISIISEVPAALSLPWELLRDDQGFLALRAKNPVTILRRLPQRELGAFSSEFTPPLRILLVTARPENAGFIDQRVIANELLDELEEQIESGAIALEFLRPPTFTALSERLGNRKLPPVHILHFDGHGSFEGEQVAADGVQFNARGALAFEHDDGNMHLVESEDLANALQDTDVRLVVLNACQSAMGNAEDVFSSVAARLIKGGVDAVAAMSTSVLVESAARYAEKFYDALANGEAVPIAHERARKALFADPRRHVHRRRRDDEGQPVVLRDWWMPHFYQQRPLTLTPKAARKRKQQSTTTLPRLTEMPDAPRYGFTGRAYELLKIERLLLRKKLVGIYGFGGNGKTAIAREAADWLTRTSLYQRALFVSFEQGGGATILLSALVNHLNVAGTYDPEKIDETLNKLKPALKKQPTLIIADNLESILPGGEAPLDSSERSKLWDVLHQLRQLGAGVLLTTRTLSFGDGKMAEGATVAYLPLGGLQPDDAYTLASNILDNLSIDRKRTPYPALRDLLVQLDHHPLAIQLVLPTLKDQPIERIRDDFAALLPTFQDDNETGRNRSLLASLEYSLRRLTDAQRALLPRLAVFEGGAMEPEILAITEIAEAEWVTLRQALEQASLIRVQRVHEAISVPFLHFHPVLTPFLRSQPGADDEELKQRYVARYHSLANYMYGEDNHNPQAVRALVWRELPNLRRALVLLVMMDELDIAVDLFDSMTRFMNIFGLWRARDELRQMVHTATTNHQPSGLLSLAEYLRESEQGEAEWSSGHIQAAYARFTQLLQRITMQPDGANLGRGSYEHCLILSWLARCLESGGQNAVAEGRLREAKVVVEALIEQQPDHQVYIRQHGVILADLGDVLTGQGKFQVARAVYKASLKIKHDIDDKRGVGITLGQLGTLALQERNYDEAARRYNEALMLFRALNEPATEAVAWHQLGVVAERQQQWAEAERAYRESLALEERIGNESGAATTCNQLANVALKAGRLAEAETWYQRALELDRAIGNDKEIASDLYNLAGLLLSEVQAGRAPQSRLAEARSYAEQALKINKNLDISSQTWKHWHILASIAHLEGHMEEARAYRRRERETFAAFEGNRYHIDRQHGRLIAVIAAAAQGNEQLRAMVEEALPKLEENGWKIADATRRIWAGERDWHALVEGLDRQDALLIKRVLETIENPEAAPQIEQRGPDMAAVLQEFEPLLQGIAAVAQGDETQRAEIEAVLADAETKGWQLTKPVQQIWVGERDAEALCEGLDEIHIALVRRILEIIAG